MLQSRIVIKDKYYQINFEKAIDLSLPISRNENPSAFYLQKAQYQTVEAGTFIGDISRGGSCNCENIIFNPHGDGTHTECAGHVAGQNIYINDVLKKFMFPAILISLSLSEKNGDFYIDAEQLGAELAHQKTFPAEAIIIRTIPNNTNKKTMDYSGTNPAYFDAAGIDILNIMGIKHILTDLPSLDKEDDSQLLAHKRFFAYPNKWNLEKTVTEMIFVPDEIKDGKYLLNLQIASFESDASPSKPIIYLLEEA